MFIYPWHNGGWAWKHVHSVWAYWQTLNVGILAFSASVAALSLAVVEARERRLRELAASRALLPDSLSELSQYLKLSSEFWKEAYRAIGDRYIDRPQRPSPPRLPEGYKLAFTRCIEVADPIDANTLTYIVVRLQINQARMRGVSDDIEGGTIMIAGTMISYLYCLGEIMALVNATYGYARSEEDHIPAALEWSDYRNWYCLPFSDISKRLQSCSPEVLS